MQSYQFYVTDMVCEGCGDLIRQAIQALDADAEITADLETKVVRVISQAQEAAIRAAIIQAGYAVQ
ncbi:heavy-metal-associated domain-containing protein [Synechococcus sp. PCC 6312]|uniref:heavy-metal-associated domain-containing protein n=1 Tax=Synechococcus sp. (strain ATCC 27167 / PCC 6312) TaxID=195253 RepID=UPI00029F0D59|nr:cation transporter [Synechococcus sp. PCC 6312]AFY59765.1 copper chaperone [Synechococcus sp. PCC 6312]